jgi:hypothetical protein
MAIRNSLAVVLAGVIVALGMQRGLDADTVAAVVQSNGFQGNTDGQTGYNQNVGWGFTPSTNISVTSLGWFDGNSTVFGQNAVGYTPGLNSSHTVGLFTSSGQLLASVTIGPGTADPIGGTPLTSMFGTHLGDFRYVGITPVSLVAGQTYIIAGNVPPGSTDPFAVVNNTPNGGSKVTTDPEITLTQGWMTKIGTTGASLLFPTIDPGYYITYFGPNFQFTASSPGGNDPPVVHNPEPAAMLIWIAGAALGLVFTVTQKRRCLVCQ